MNSIGQESPVRKFAVDNGTSWRFSLGSRIILMGDLNYRVSLSYEETKTLLEDNDWDALLQKDQVR